MSVYTRVERSQLELFLARFDLGALVEYQGIGAGVENTNYFVSTDTGEFVLTLFERLGFDELPYFLELMAHLTDQGVPSARPLPDAEGRYLHQLQGRPAALVQRLPGVSVLLPAIEHCAAIGAGLARMHLAGQAFSAVRENQRALAWRRQAAQQVLPCLSEAEQSLLNEELRFQALYRHGDLPHGVIHADLFRDNVLFDGVQLTGMIDFYSACHEALLYDVAVTVNDWCSQADGTPDAARTMALLDGYHAVRPLRAIERGAWPVMLRAAALRFWLSRLLDKHFQREGELTHLKDPDEFKRILKAHIARGEAAVWRS